LSRKIIYYTNSNISNYISNDIINYQNKNFKKFITILLVQGNHFILNIKYNNGFFKFYSMQNHGKVSRGQFDYVFSQICGYIYLKN
jgi:hypothetical protein